MSLMWINGEFCSRETVKISPFDHGLVTGDGLFEVVAAYDGQPFAVTRHIERIKNSARAFYIPVEFLDEVSWAEVITELLAKNNLKSARVRITVTTGEADLGSDRGSAPPLIFIAAGAMPAFASSGALALVPWSRNERGAMAGIKSTSYGENVKALYFAKKKSATEALFLNTQGQVCEGTGTNIFWISQGKLFTPALSTGCLAGITRALVIERARVRGQIVYEVSVPLSDLLAADSVFLTSTLRDVQWIQRIDEKTWPASSAELVEELRADFVSFSRQNLDP